MKQVSVVPSFTYSIKAYSLLTKPGILFGNLITATAGFSLGSKYGFHGWLFFLTLCGIGAIIASGCVFNNYIDRKADQKMQRTKTRALVTGEIAPLSALTLATCLFFLGSFVLAQVSLYALGIALFGLFVYVVLYSFSKYYSVHGTLVGSIAGAVPPLASYVAARNVLDMPGFLFFWVMIFWQMPHFFAIAILQMEDYKKANIPVLPLEKGLFRTKIAMLFYCLAFLVSSAFLGMYLGKLYLFVTLALSFYWVKLAVEGFLEPEEKVWAKKMFQASLLIIFLLSGIIAYVSLSPTHS